MNQLQHLQTIMSPIILQLRNAKYINHIHQIPLYHLSLPRPMIMNQCKIIKIRMSHHQPPAVSSITCIIWTQRCLVCCSQYHLVISVIMPITNNHSGVMPQLLNTFPCKTSADADAIDEHRVKWICGECAGKDKSDKQEIMQQYD